MSDKPSDERSRLRNLKRALSEADRLANKLDIPRNVRTDGSSIYRRLRREGKLPGRSVEEVVAATLYLACRDHGVARTPDEFVTHYEFDRTTFLRTVTFVEEVMDLGIPPASPQTYVEKFGNELALEQETIEQAKELLDAAEDSGVLFGISPTGGAAGAIYAAGQITGDRPTQGEISNVADVSEVTIRKRYPDILQADPDADSKEYSQD